MDLLINLARNHPWQTELFFGCQDTLLAFGSARPNCPALGKPRSGQRRRNTGTSRVHAWR